MAAVACEPSPQARDPQLAVLEDARLALEAAGRMLYEKEEEVLHRNMYPARATRCIMHDLSLGYSQVLTVH